jgi:hypothetical protein
MNNKRKRKKKKKTGGSFSPKRNHYKNPHQKNKKIPLNLMRIPRGLTMHWKGRQDMNEMPALTGQVQLIDQVTGSLGPYQRSWESGE